MEKMEKKLVSKELRDEALAYIMRKRLELKDDCIDDAVVALEAGCSYSCVNDVIHQIASTNMGQVIGMYNLGWNLGIISDDDIASLCETACNMFDEVLIMHSAIKRLKGKKENGNKA